MDSTIFRRPSRSRVLTLMLAAGLTSGACSKLPSFFNSEGTPASTETKAAAPAPTSPEGDAKSGAGGVAPPVEAASPAKPRARTPSGRTPEPLASAMPAEAGAAGIPVEIIPPEPELVPLVAPDRTSSASAATIAAAAPSPAVARRPGGDLMPIYSDDDQDVVPARLLTTQTGGPLFRGIQPDMNTMELLISPQGRVEQVRLISPTKRMTDMLLLSGAKTWKFAPALRDGEPVRYRTMFSWEVTR